MPASALMPSAGLAVVRAAFLTYAACVLAIAAIARLLDPHLSVVAVVGAHAALLALAWLLPAGHRASRAVWTVLVLLGLPLAFSAVGLALPGLHPQPFEWRCIACDRWVFGCDPGVAVQAWLRPSPGASLGPWLVEVLQLAYASFYFLPAAVLLALLRGRRRPAYDATLAAVTVGFLLSYLGYYLFPTLPPYRYLDHGGDLVGLGLAERVHFWLDRLEANHFDCMPSGHTMMTLVTLMLARRHTPRLFWVLLPVATALVLATVALRYHYVVDVIAGALLAPVALRAADWLCAAPA